MERERERIPVIVRDWERDGAEGGLGGGRRLRGCRRWIGRRRNGRWDETVERNVRCEVGRSLRLGCK